MVAAAFALVLSLPALAATGLDPDCPSLDAAAEIAPPSLAVEFVDRSVTSTAMPTDLETGKEQTAVGSKGPTRSDTVARELFGEEEIAADDASDSEPRQEMPPTATRLPGVSEENMPRFRQRMFRTDI